MAGDQGQGRGVRDVPLVLVAAVARNGDYRREGRIALAALERPETFQGANLGQAAGDGAEDLRIDRPRLPGRETIVVTRDSTFAPAGAFVAQNLDAALDLAA